ncbi:MAG: TRAP transporter substrate-binding protein [Desulfobacteraceae bacterium]|nr:TRAP transporter substrate-binding protein [Desulfobacteraceae bacterium]MBC2751953.1 TRAP transporter substrate-binding protein [Desulfobacteraceae bacterium]
MQKLLLAMLVGCFCLTPLSAFGAMTIKLGVVTKPGSAQNIVAEKFKALMEARSGGEVTVKIYHSKSIGNETEILQQIQMNTVQMGIITVGPFDTFDPIVRVVNYPFLFKNNEQADAILDGPLGQEILTSLESSGFKGLCFSENGFRNLTNNKRAVRAPEDVDGLKIRVMSSALHKTIWQTLGANPTPMPWPIYTELEQGVIDGQENPLWVMTEYKFYEIQKYMTLTRHVYSPHIDVASLRWWNTIDAPTQAMILKAIREAADYQRKDNREKDAARLAYLKEKGMEVEESPDLAAFRTKLVSLQSNSIYSDPTVNDLLRRMLEATR